jgi:lipopolysaccharide transport system permease protein
MYVSAVVYPMALVAKNARRFFQVQSIAYIIESTRYILNVGELSVFGLLYTFMVTMIVFFSRYSDFNKTEKSYR